MYKTGLFIEVYSSLTVLVCQQEQALDGDRFYHEPYLPEHVCNLVESQTLAAFLRHNTTLGEELPVHVFYVD